jgi:hypothetical protein
VLDSGSCTKLSERPKVRSSNTSYPPHGGMISPVKLAGEIMSLFIRCQKNGLGSRVHASLLSLAILIAGAFAFPHFAFADYVAFQNLLPIPTVSSTHEAHYGFSSGSSMSMEYVATSTVTQFDRVTLPFCKQSGTFGGEVYLEVRTTSSTTGPIIASSTLAMNSGNVWTGCGSGSNLNATTSTWVLNQNVQWISDVHIFFNFRPVGVSGTYNFTFNDYDDVQNYYTVFCTISTGLCSNASFGTTYHIDSLTIKGQALGTAPQIYATSTSAVACSTFDVGCYIATAFEFLFYPSIPLSDQLSELSSTTASVIPFGYVYSIVDLFTEYSNLATSTLSVSVELSSILNFMGGNFSSTSVTVLSGSGLRATLGTTLWDLSQNLFRAGLWFGFLWYVYHRSRKFL